MNLPTIAVASVVALVFLAIIIKGIKNRSEGKHSCSCGCGGCAMKDTCHSKEK